MKTTEKVSLVACASGLAAGLGLWWLLPEAHWGVYVVFGFIVMGGAYSGITQQIAADRVVDRDLAPKQKR